MENRSRLIWKMKNTADLSRRFPFYSQSTILVPYLGWWLDRDFYGLTGSKGDFDSNYHAGFILPESPVAAGLSHLTPQLFLWTSFVHRIRVSRPYLLFGSGRRRNGAPSRITPNRISQLLLNAVRPISLLTCFIDKRFDLFGVNHPAKRGMNGRCRIGIVRKVHEFCLLYSDFYYSRSEAIGMGAKKCANCAHKSRLTAEFIQCGQVVAFNILILAGLRQGSDRSRVLFYARLKLITLLNGIFQFCQETIHCFDDWRFAHA